MNYIINGYKPEAMFRFFEDICSIPHGSGNEDKIACYIESFALERGLYCYRDSYNNVFIRRPATHGYEKRPAVLLQGHTDMVCEKNDDTVHDFEKDGLKLYIDGDYLRARGTTLGGDDGVAIALMLSVLDDETLISPELECLFTSGEEIGLTGADNFDYGQITARSMINLDGESEGVAWVSCAGGIHTKIRCNCDRIPLKNKTLRIRVTGLAGGHSGTDIDKNRANAIKIMSRILLNLYDFEPFNLLSITGGNKSNAIPRECEAYLSVLDPEIAIRNILLSESAIKAELSEDDASFKVHVDKARKEGGMMTYKSTANLLSLITLAPNGVLTMSPSINTLVESSANLGMISSDESEVMLAFMNRSSVESIMDYICLRFEQLAKVTRSDITHSSRYPGWTYNSNSRLQKIYSDTYRRLFGNKTPVISAVHAGLECGVIKNKIENIDIISVGPEINNIHTPDEVLNLKSFERFRLLIIEMLNQI
ncbi:MAG: beta-Ala-His dipeptidase [Eubacteriales bacterium]|jgi:dipeptidase D|nr:beta-Ala-His dipeptidase [Eubacteriales bacterium]